MSTLPEDFYDCLVATLFREKARMHTEISHFSHGLRLYSRETRVKDRHKNVLDIVCVRQTSKAMLAAVRALETDELRAALRLFWQSTDTVPCESFIFPSSSDVPERLKTHRMLINQPKFKSAVVFRAMMSTSPPPSTRMEAFRARYSSMDAPGTGVLKTRKGEKVLDLV
jgi:hypothetical protein